MLIQIFCVLVFPGAFACSDCFSKCSNSDKNECLLDCGCPLFTSSRVYPGSFQGSAGLVYVAELNPTMAKWVQLSLTCDLQCSSVCSSSYLDSKLESCVQSCGCGSLISATSITKEDSVKAKCDSICRGSPYGCFLDCVGHIEELSSPVYLWVAFPSLILVLLLAWFVIKPKKEDDYLRI